MMPAGSTTGAQARSTFRFASAGTFVKLAPAVTDRGPRGCDQRPLGRCSNFAANSPRTLSIFQERRVSRTREL